MVGIEPFANREAFFQALNLTRGVLPTVHGPFAALSPVKKVRPSPLPSGGLLVYDDEAGDRLLSFPLNGVELPRTVSCFAFLGEADSMAFGVQRVASLFLGDVFIPSKRTPVCHFGHQNGHQESFPG
jgi:hypothetical protein